MKKLLLTGGCGFVGKNIKPILEKTYRVTSCGRNTGNDIAVDIANSIPELPERYDIILHACGKAHSNPQTDEEIQEFFNVNSQGTKNLCFALEKVGLPESFIFLSSVCVYGCDTGEMIDESYPLDGATPYAKSKIEAEEYLEKWCAEHGVILSILRPALLVGSNPPGNLGAMIKGIKSGRYMSIAGGKARKSVMMVDDIANLVPLTATVGGIYNICDDYHPKFKDIEDLICYQLRKRRPLSIPYWIAKCLSLFGDVMGDYAPINSVRLRKITNSLTFCNDKAKRILGWKPISVTDNFRIV